MDNVKKVYELIRTVRDLKVYEIAKILKDYMGHILHDRLKYWA